jgi:uncharacterized protein YukJ
MLCNNAQNIIYGETQMPIEGYGVLKGHPVNKRLGTSANAHYHVHLVDDNTDYRIAINVQSQMSPSDLEYLVDDAFQHPILAELSQLPAGFKPLPSKPNGLAIDFIRSNLFDPAQMKPLPFNVPGPDNDLNEKIDTYIQRAMSDEAAMIYAFGQRWGPEPKVKDKIFGFLPGNGIHDIHMNQGNAGQFTKDDGVYQDGALIIHFPNENQWVGIFLKFQSQTWHTDDRTGHRDDSAPLPVPPVVDKEPEAPAKAEPPVQIVAALVNPQGQGAKTVTLINASSKSVNLQGWMLANRQKDKQPLSGTIEPGATIVVSLPEAMDLSEQGGIITLLNSQGLKVDGVAYTKEQASRDGWTIVF